VLSSRGIRSRSLRPRKEDREIMRIDKAVVVVALAALPAAAEDLTIVSKFTGPKGMSMTSTQYFSAGKFRVSNGENDSIFDAAAGRMVVVDHRKKEYWETSIDEMNAMMEKANQQMRQMQEQLKGNPMAEKMMGGMMGGALGQVSVQKGASPKKVAGYDCDHYVATMGEAIKMDIWTTSALQPPPQLYDARKAFNVGPMAQGFVKVYEEMKKIKGFTLAETTSLKMMGQSLQTSSEATEVKKGPIPASAFEVPAGYKKAESPYKKMK
jgi:hypothetical protein